MMKYVQLSLVGLLCLIPLSAQGDTIVLDGELHEGVLVRESSSMYYVQFPEDGTVRSVLRTKVDAGDVSRAESDAERDLLRAKWRMSRNASRQSRNPTPISEGPGLSTMFDNRAAAPPVEVATAASRDPGASLPGLAPSITQVPIAPVASSGPPTPLGGEIVTDGMVDYVNLKNVTLREALKVILHPLNLDFSVQSGAIWISTPEKIRTESFEDLETRHYSLKNAGAETLFKIVLSNPGGPGGGG